MSASSWEKSRTRTSIATSEALQALRLVGLEEEIVKVQGAGPTSTVARIQLKSWGAVSRAMTRFKEVHLFSPHGHPDNGGRLWASRMKTFNEIQRTSPVSRAHRKMNDIVDRWEAQGWIAQFQLEASYKPGDEAVFVSWNNWVAEDKILYRNEEGRWIVNDTIYDQCGFDIPAASFLSECL